MVSRSSAHLNIRYALHEGLSLTSARFRQGRARASRRADRRLRFLSGRSLPARSRGQVGEMRAIEAGTDLVLGQRQPTEVAPSLEPPDHLLVEAQARGHTMWLWLHGVPRLRADA